MITLEAIEQEIDKFLNSGMCYNNLQKLSLLYDIKEHLEEDHKEEPALEAMRTVAE